MYFNIHISCTQYNAKFICLQSIYKMYEGTRFVVIHFCLFGLQKFVEALLYLFHVTYVETGSVGDILTGHLMVVTYDVQMKMHLEGDDRFNILLKLLIFHDNIFEYIITLNCFKFDYFVWFKNDMI